MKHDSHFVKELIGFLMGTSLQDCDSTPGGVVAHYQFGSIRAGKFKRH